MSAEQTPGPMWDEASPESRRLAIRFVNWCSAMERAYPGLPSFMLPVHVRTGWALFYLHTWTGGGLAIRMIDGEPYFPWILFEKALGCDSEVAVEIEIDIYGDTTGHLRRDRGIPYVRVNSLPAVVQPLSNCDYLMSDEGKRRLQMLACVWGDTVRGVMDTDPDVKRQLDEAEPAKGG